MMALAGLAGKALRDTRLGIPVCKRGSVCIAPIIPVCPVVFWGLALLVDYVAYPWGTWSIGSIHVAAFCCYLVLFARDFRRIRILDKQA